ncbi:hypothetical protein BDE02_18G100000 [Populus trichocarpa]|nr:hypothetical protein BDE02_18G100000 [Populus trichocarpa]
MNPIVASEIHTNRFDFLGEKIFYNCADHTEDCLENSSWEDKVLKKIGGGGCRGKEEGNGSY